VVFEIGLIFILSVDKRKNMPKSKAIKATLPIRVEEELVRIGRNIKLARKRRQMSVAELSTRMFVNEKTLRRLEQGEAGVGIGVLANAMYCLGLSGFAELAAPETDRQGVLLEEQRLLSSRRVRGKKLEEPDTNF
jgi:transcriptional regulator with XRE-family HTH domain